MNRVVLAGAAPGPGWIVAGPPGVLIGVDAPVSALRHPVTDPMPATAKNSNARLIRSIFNSLSRCTVRLQSVASGIREGLARPFSAARPKDRPGVFVAAVAGGWSHSSSGNGFLEHESVHQQPAVRVSTTRNPNPKPSFPASFTTWLTVIN